MAKVNILAEIMNHDEREIIEFATEEAKAIRATFLAASKENKPEKFYSVAADLEILTSILIALDRRNKEHTLK